ncbi:MAG: hypothetical protein KC506_02100, partial [Nanoarchaeota archaeon]|nr:hypothetical protein [Nanoarchaeota archaeon]
VGFARESPSHILITGYWDESLDVEGYAASPLVLAGSGTRRFVENYSRGEEGYAQARPLDLDFNLGGSMQIDTGPGSERYFIFRARPQGSGQVIVGIDSLKVGV